MHTRFHSIKGKHSAGVNHDVEHPNVPEGNLHRQQHRRLVDHLHEMYRLFLRLPLAYGSR